MGGDSDKQIDIADPFARQLMARYLARRKQDIERLRAALDAADYGSISVTGHKLLGSGAAYGLDRVSELGRDIETAAHHGDGHRLARLIDELSRYLAQIHIRHA